MNFFQIDSPFAVFVNKLVQMIYTGILWFIYSLPVVTIGAATTALYEVLMKVENNHEGYIGASFFRAFCRNLKSATLVWLPLLIALAVFGFNLFFYLIFGGGQFPVQCVVFALLLVLAVILSGYVFPVLARFENTTAATFRFALLLAVRNPVWTVVVLFLQLLTFFVCWFFLYFPLMFIMGLTGYVQAVVFNHIFDRMIEKGTITVTQKKNNAVNGGEECDRTA